MNETIKGVQDTLEEGFTKIAEAYGIPESFHKEAKEALSDEVEIMAKEAGFFGDMASGATQKAVGMAGKGFSGGTGAVLGAGAVAVGGILAADAIKGLASMAINKIGRNFGEASNRTAYEAAFRKALQSSEILQNDPIKAKRMADSIFGFAPTVASDSNVLVNILSNSIHGESMDLQTIKTVTELEEKINKMKQH